MTDRRQRQDDEAQWRLQAGAARTALDHRLKRPMTDAYGRALPIVQGLAEGFSLRGLSRLATGKRRIMVSLR